MPGSGPPHGARQNGIGAVLTQVGVVAHECHGKRVMVARGDVGAAARSTRLDSPSPQPTSRMRSPAMGITSIASASAKPAGQITPKSGQDAGVTPARSASPSGSNIAVGPTARAPGSRASRCGTCSSLPCSQSPGGLGLLRLQFRDALLFLRA